MSNDLLVVDSIDGLIGAPGVAEVAVRAAAAPTSAKEVRARLVRWEARFVGGHPKATVRAVRADWGQYVSWCQGLRRSPLPASVLQLEEFVRSAIVLGRKRSTVQRYVYTINLVHKAAGLPSPAAHADWPETWKMLLKHLKARGGLITKQAGALEYTDVQTILATLGESPRDLRDAAMLALASDTLVRESELVAVRVEHFEHNRTKGVWTLLVPFSKSNQDGRGDYRFVDGPTMDGVRRWLDVAGITSGFVFLPIGGRPKSPPPEDENTLELAGQNDVDLREATRSADEIQPLGAEQVARIFRRRARAAGLEHAPTVSGHSTRIGTANDLINAGKTTAQIQHAGGWRSAEMVNLYTRRSQAGVNAVAELRGSCKPK
ncbi:hypothetical protein RHOFW510R12_01200 [Rhodanobacter sp. FW510-R12]|uniref:tyrosine-type recombinase/integrase n=1 Tax=Rhodanobacter thiooxydans TaxID=416169 RepID=UPI00091BD8A6|nr:tyrosine-type recombinase/integrase [Rhodanobacter thiooxydans]UJJ56644.1 tyrosine-type recombinase/integrase [Rhodanobacter thiooxydans]